MTFSKKIFFSCLGLLLYLRTAVAQDTLTLEEAIRIGLENNYSITLAKNSLEIAQINNTYEGMMPTITLSGTQTNNVSNSYLKPFSGPIREGSNLVANSLVGSAMLNWTVFDGFNMFVTKDKLEELEKNGEIQTRMAIEQTISNIIVSYHGVVLQNKMKHQMEEALKISIQRKKIMGYRYQVGASSNLNFMEAQADLNADSSALIQQEVSCKNLKADLNRLLARDAAIEFQVSSLMKLDESLAYASILEKAKSQNTSLLLARQNERIAALTVDQAKSGRYPQLNLFGGYNYSRSTFAIGFAQLSRSYGPTYGASVSWNLYGAGATNRAIQNSKILQKSQEVQRKELELSINNELYKLYNQYQMNLQLVGIEKKNLEVTRKNVEVALEKYDVGSLSNIELRAVQSSFLEASSRLLNAMYLAKQNETELLAISGQLIK